jgi:hypothetical protein
MPDIDLNKELGLGFTRDSWQSGSTSNTSQQQKPQEDLMCPQPADLAVSILRKIDHAYIPLEASDEDYANLKLVDDIKHLKINPSDHRFFGKSSGAMLIQTALDLKQEYTGKETSIKHVLLGERRPYIWEPYAVSCFSVIHSLVDYSTSGKRQLQNILIMFSLKMIFFIP